MTGKENSLGSSALFHTFSSRGVFLEGPQWLDSLETGVTIRTMTEVQQLQGPETLLRPHIIDSSHD